MFLNAVAVYHFNKVMHDLQKGKQMNTIDIRNTPVPQVQRVRFADNSGGSSKGVMLERVVPTQLKIIHQDGVNYTTVERKSIDHLIKALKYAKEHWGE